MRFAITALVAVAVVIALLVMFAFHLKFWLRKNAKCTNTRGQKFLTGRKRKFHWNQISDSPAECLCVRAVLSARRFIRNKNWTANIWMWNAFIHSYSLVVSLCVCRGQFASSCWPNSLPEWLQTFLSKTLLNFQGEKIFYKPSLIFFDAIRNKSPKITQCWMIARAYPYLDTISRTSFIIIIRINAERHKTHTHRPINFSVLHFFCAIPMHTQNTYWFLCASFLWSTA